MVKADKYFKNTLYEILYNGSSTEGQLVRPKYKDGTPSHTLFINHVCETFDIDKGEFPIISLRPTAWKSGIKEILWIYQDQTSDLGVLENKYNIHWWNDWNIGNGTIGCRYGATVKKYDLMNNLLKGLKEQPYTRRHIMNLYQYSDFNQTDGLYPCAFQSVWTVRDGYLDMSLHQRSSDFCTANVINKIQYVALQMMVARHVGLKVGKFTHFVDNVHIYDRHIEQAKELLSRPSNGKQAKLILKEGKTNFYDFTIDDFEIVDYDPNRNQLKFELAI